MIGVAPATPRPPMPFPSIAAISPAMKVPWPTVSVTVVPPFSMSTPGPDAPLEIRVGHVDAAVQHRHAHARSTAHRDDAAAGPHRVVGPVEGPSGVGVHGLGELGAEVPHEHGLHELHAPVPAQQAAQGLGVAGRDLHAADAGDRIDLPARRADARGDGAGLGRGGGAHHHPGLDAGRRSPQTRRGDGEAEDDPESEEGTGHGTSRQSRGVRTQGKCAGRRGRPGRRSRLAGTDPRTGGPCRIGAGCR